MRNSKTDIVGLARMSQLDVRVDGAIVKSYMVGGVEDDGTSALSRAPVDGQNDPLHTFDENMKLRIPVKTGTHSVAVAFLKITTEPEKSFQPPATDYAYTQDSSVRQL